MKKYIFILFLGIFSLFALRTTPVLAASPEECHTSTLNTAVKLPTGLYDLYVKNKQFDGIGSFKFTAQNSLTDSCEVLTSTVVKGVFFSKVTTFTNTSSDILSIGLSLPESSSNPTFLELYLVPQGTTPCDLLTKNCTVMYEGNEMELSPKKLSYSLDSLRAGLLVPIESEPIKRVVYAINGVQVYERKQLEPFDERYVSGGEHSTTRKIVFENGQTLSETSVIKRGTIADVLFTFQAFYFRSSELIKIMLFILVPLLVFLLIRSSIRYIVKKRNYNLTHSAGKGWSIDPSKVGPQKNFYDESLMRVLYRYRKIWGAFIITCAILLGSSYFLLSVFTVDGLSMYPTLQDKSKKMLVRAPRTFASISRNDYIPARGTIVVVNKSEENSFTEEQAVVEDNFVVKRVVGIPQDRVVVKDGIIKIFNVENPEGFVPDDTYKWISDTTGSEYFSIDTTLKDGEVFVVGDNRDESVDSRFYGAVEASKIVGTVIK